MNPEPHASLEPTKAMIDVRLCPNVEALGAAVARIGAAAMTAAIAERGHASIILATGMSQFATLEHLAVTSGIDWSRVTAFHLDEYVGLPESHRASFRRYLRGRFLAKLPHQPHFVPVDGDAANTSAELARLNAAISGHDIDVCFAGIGENAHLAFNDPPADFTTTEPFLVVELDEACRHQQLGEGWFPTLEAVPKHAISMSIRQILKSRLILLSAPDERKARAVKATLEGAVSPDVPASILQQHGHTMLFLDPASASLLHHKPAMAA